MSFGHLPFRVSLYECGPGTVQNEELKLAQMHN